MNILIVKTGPEKGIFEKIKKHSNTISLDVPEYPTILNKLYLMLNRMHHEVTILDEMHDTHIGNLENMQDLVIVYSRQYDYKHIKQIRNIINNDIPVIVFSYNVCSNPLLFINDLKDNLYFAYGEIEPIISCIKDTNMHSCPNIFYKINDKVTVNDRVYANLDSLPIPDFENPQIKNYVKFNKYIPIEFSRGCNYHCNHCPTHYFYGADVRRVSTNHIHETLHSYRNSTEGYDTICSIVDNNIINDMDWFRSLLKGLKKLDINWTCRLRPDWVTQKITNLLSTHNCKEVILSADVIYDYEPALSTFLNKIITLKDLRNASKMLENVGINVSLYFIVGMYSNPKKMILEVVEMCKADRILLTSYVRKYENYKNPH